MCTGDKHIHIARDVQAIAAPQSRAICFYLFNRGPSMLRFALLASVLAAFALPAAAEEAKLPRVISISGHGEVRGRPDIAVVTIGVLRSAESAREALDANNAAMAEIIKALESAGIAGSDIQTTNFAVNPRYNYSSSSGEPPKASGYDVSNNVTVTVRKLETLGAVLDQAVSSGSNQINGVMFSFAKPGPMQDEARKLAVEDAKRKAGLYVAAAGVALGPVVSINEGGAYQPPVPMAKTAAAEQAGAVPVAEGEQAVAIDVNIVWEIK
jgi:uncharacterized protein